MNKMLQFNQIDLLENFELCCSDNNDKKKLIMSLLYCPWNCPDELVIRYVEVKLAQCILKFKYSVHYFIFNQPTPNKLFNFIKRVEICSILKQQGNETITSLYDFALNERELFIDLITEDLLAKTDKTWLQLSEHAQDLLIGLYMCGSIAIYNIANIIVKSINTNVFRIRTEWLTAFDIKNFRSKLNYLSRISDTMFVYELFPFLIKLKKQGKPLKNSDKLIFLALKFIDKFFSIHPDYIRNYQRIEAMRKLIEHMQLLVFLWSYALMKAYEEKRNNVGIHDTTPINKYEIIKAGFTESEINSLLDNDSVLTSERIIEKVKDTDIYHIRYLDIKYAAQIYSKKLLFPILTNKWFEQGYLINYLKEVLPSNRFIIGNTIESKRNSNIGSYDVDVVIYDNTTEFFYFCQIKHRESSMLIGLRGELLEYEKNTRFVQKGISQLKNLRSNINQPQIKAQLITAFQGTKIGSKFINNTDFTKNSRFLLIHNVENFDFCTKEGISMYEWNTFRNLLQGRYWEVSMNNTSQKEFISNHIDFSNLIAVKKIINESYTKQNDSIEARGLIKYLTIRYTYNIQFFGKTVPFYQIKKEIEIPVI